MDIVRTSDRVDVVRCRDCRFALPDEVGNRFCIWTNRYIDPNGYCSDGERRENDD